MKNLILLLAFSTALFINCNNKHTHDVVEETTEISNISHTIYSDKTEVFIEYSPFIVGTESSIIAHFTVLGEQFKALEEATINVSLSVGESLEELKTDSFKSPGIVKIAITPKQAGMGKLTINIKNKEYSDKIVIENVKVFPDLSMAQKEQVEKEDPNKISFLKEQAWKIDFANKQLKKQSFSSIIKTSGQILPSPGDEVVLSSQINGVISLPSNANIQGYFIKAGTTLYKIKNNNLIEESVNTELKQAEEILKTAQINFERASELVKDKIISQNEYLEAKLKYENAKTTYEQSKGSRSFYSNSQSVTSPIDGYIKQVLVSQGEIVTIGQPLAIISKNKKYMLQANLSQNYFNKLPSITSANFKTTNNDEIYNTQDLNGKVISYGKSVSANSPFIPIIFEIENNGKLISGSIAEVYLKSTPIENALVIPISSLVEEQGFFFVFVQTGGESFQKREVKIATTDGVNAQVISGIKEGERVVTKGAFQIKLAAASGTMPEHSHEH